MCHDCYIHACIIQQWSARAVLRCVLARVVGLVASSEEPKCRIEEPQHVNRAMASMDRASEEPFPPFFLVMWHPKSIQNSGCGVQHRADVRVHVRKLKCQWAAGWLAGKELLSFVPALAFCPFFSEATTTCIICRSTST